MTTLENIQTKIMTVGELKGKLDAWQSSCKKTVFTNGCFDVLHRGHIEYLAKASEMGDILIVGLNTDSSVKRLKGDSRPVNDQYARALLLAALCFVDAVTLFDEDTPYDLIKTVMPDILVKGGDYATADIVGRDIVEGNGGKVLTIPLTEGYSSTSIMRKAGL